MASRSRFGKEAVQGLAQARKAFKALPDIAREALADATDETAEYVRAAAVRRVPVRFGFLQKHIAKKVSRKTGVATVGIAKGQDTTPDGKRVDPSRYAHLVEFGSVHNEASHFMLNSLEEQRGPFLERCRKAGKTIEADTANVGSRFV